MIRYSGSEIAAAFGMPDPITPCSTCGHKRYEHRREIIVPGPAPQHREEHHECERWDRRRRSGVCSCEKYTEPIEPDPT
jgi:hypothetical protein